MTIRRIKCAPLGDDEEDCGLDGVKPVMEDFLGRGEVGSYPLPWGALCMAFCFVGHDPFLFLVS